ncbi:LacI family DNA-binding transcriptional regulator [Vallitalea okinawensis]|uniref:LacI family DNA-binding transcriptional regulator n=1 Tax=Vallitalea okinawensis TaxID=2078660 RepID=UPI000CFAFF2C|nr:LacI family DNA-binding transcriptional regulator [Vallitalea okinawensis]
MITIYDIAKEVGCSSATVSKALNNYPDVNAKTRKKILDKAKEMGYSPNSQAQALTKKKTWNIGVLFEVEGKSRTGLTHYFFAQILESFKEYAEELGYDLTFVSEKIGNDPVSFLQHVRRRHCDGVIIANFDYENEKILELIHSKIPVVVIDYNYDTVSSILSDNYEGLKLLTQYLMDLNHKEIVYIHGQHNYVTDIRLNAFIDTLTDNGITVTEDHLLEGMYYDKDKIYNKTLEVLQREDPPTAIIFSDDYAAVWGGKAIEKMGLRIPEDISIAGFDGLEISEMMKPRLTTVKQDTNLIGKQAAKRLIDIIETKNHSKVDIHVGVELIKGESCKKIGN